MFLRRFPMLVVVSLLCAETLHAQNHTDRGAALGGIAGALAGAAIGNHNDETAAGALIGGAVGLITGAAIGNAKDEDIARARAYQNQRHWQLQRAVSIQDVVTMTRNGLGDHVIVSHIQQNGVQRQLEVPDVIALHQQGVSEVVITAMQRAPLATATHRSTYVQPAPVVVQEHYYAPRSYYRSHVPHYHHHHLHRPHYHRRPGVHWGITIGR